MADPELVAQAKQAVGSPGLSKTEDAKLNDWLGKVEDVQKAVQYLLSDEYVEKKQKCEDEVGGEGGSTAADTPLRPIAPEVKRRYTTDYSRFDNAEFVKEVKPKKLTASAREKEQREKLENIGERPSSGDPKELAEYLCKKESLEYRKKGNEAYQKQDYKKAEELYSSGLALNEQNYLIRSNRAQARIKLAGWQGALDDCNVVLEQEPFNMKVTKRRAVALTKLRRSNESLSDIERAIKHEGETKELREMKQAALVEAEQEEKVNAADAEQLQKLREETREVMKGAAGGAAVLERIAERLAEGGDAACAVFAWEGGVEGVLPLLDSDFEPVCAVLSQALRPQYVRNRVDIEPAVPSLASRCHTSPSPLRVLTLATQDDEGTRRSLLKHLPAERIFSIPYRISVLHLADNLLKSDRWCDALSGHPLPDMVLPLLVQQGRDDVREAAAAVVMRLTTDLRFRPGLAERGGVLAGCLSEDRTPFELEAVLAALHNCLVDRGTSAATPEVATRCVSLVRSPINVAVSARALAVLSKLLPLCPEAHGIVQRSDCINALFGFVAAEEDGEYPATCRENAVSLLAALLAKDPSTVSASFPPKDSTVGTFLGCLKRSDRTCGNAALVFSELCKLPEWHRHFTAPGVSEVMIDGLLGVIKQKRKERREEEAHQQLLLAEGRAPNAPVSFRLNEQTQRNAAIALAKLSKDPGALEVLRRKQGMDVLATTLGFVNTKQP